MLAFFQAYPDKKQYTIFLLARIGKMLLVLHCQKTLSQRKGLHDSRNRN